MRSYMLPTKTCQTWFFLIVLILTLSILSAAQRPDLFFYPPPYQLAPGQVVSSPVAVDVAQVTEDYPDIAEMSGIVLPVYWSRLCPEEHHCDFSLIDRALDYWGRRGKKVILSVVTFGHPMTVLHSGNRMLETPTPDWVLKQVATFKMDAPPIVPVTHPYVPTPRVSTIFPSYWDAGFLSAVKGLIDRLARYDGNPTISKIRIGTGIMGEDNPSFDGLKNSMPGWSNVAWINYSRSVADAYLHSFKRTRLEFDVDRLGWIAATGTTNDQSAANALIDYFNKQKIFLAMNGFDTNNIAQWKAKSWKNGTARSMEWIASRERSGSDGGLEGAPLFVPLLQNVDTLASTFREIKANRLVLFSDVPGALNYERSGPNAKNETTREALSPQTLSLVTDHAQRLFSLLGFEEKNSARQDKAAPAN